jgi:hypothetical protein
MKLGFIFKRRHTSSYQMLQISSASWPRRVLVRPHFARERMNGLSAWPTCLLCPVVQVAGSGNLARNTPHFVVRSRLPDFRLFWLPKSHLNMKTSKFISSRFNWIRLLRDTLDRLCDLVVRVQGYRARVPGFDSLRYQISCEIVGLDRGHSSSWG